MKRILQLGCGLAPITGAVNHDLAKHSPHVDVSHDLNSAPWPWADGSFDVIVAKDVVEHLRVDVNVWLDECHRILLVGGHLELRVPYYRHENAFTDPTHRRFFTPKTFDYWDRSKELHQKYGCFYYSEPSRWWTVALSETDGADIVFLLIKQE